MEFNSINTYSFFFKILNTNDRNLFINYKENLQEVMMIRKLVIDIHKLTDINLIVLILKDKEEYYIDQIADLWDCEDDVVRKMKNNLFVNNVLNPEKIMFDELNLKKLTKLIKENYILIMYSLKVFMMNDKLNVFFSSEYNKNKKMSLEVHNLNYKILDICSDFEIVFIILSNSDDFNSRLNGNLCKTVCNCLGSREFFNWFCQLVTRLVYKYHDIIY